MLSLINAATSIVGAAAAAAAGAALGAGRAFVSASGSAELAKPLQRSCAWPAARGGGQQRGEGAASTATRRAVAAPGRKLSGLAGSKHTAGSGAATEPAAGGMMLLLLALVGGRRAGGGVVVGTRGGGPAAGRGRWWACRLASAQTEGAAADPNRNYLLCRARDAASSVIRVRRLLMERCESTDNRTVVAGNAAVIAD